MTRMTRWSEDTVAKVESDEMMVGTLVERILGENTKIEGRKWERRREGRDTHLWACGE